MRQMLDNIDRNSEDADNLAFIRHIKDSLATVYTGTSSCLSIIYLYLNFTSTVVAGSDTVRFPFDPCSFNLLMTALLRKLDHVHARYFHPCNDHVS